LLSSSLSSLLMVADDKRLRLGAAALPRFGLVGV
jgi:hypothetical protein